MVESHAGPTGSCFDTKGKAMLPGLHVQSWVI